MHLAVALPDTIRLVGYMALSPDGRTLVISGIGADGKSTLSLRPLGSDQLRQLPGTELARAPFWSADGNNVAFSVNGKLEFVAANGGPAQELCDGVGEGGTWNRDNVILISGPKGQIFSWRHDKVEPKEIVFPIQQGWREGLGMYGRALFHKLF